MKKMITTTALILAAFGATASVHAAPLTAPKAAIATEAKSDAVHDVRWRGHHRGWHGGRWGGRGIGLGIAGGVIAGALIAESIREGRASESSIQACADRYRSFDPATGTYLSYDGNRYVCPYL